MAVPPGGAGGVPHPLQPALDAATAHLNQVASLHPRIIGPGGGVPPAVQQALNALIHIQQQMGNPPGMPPVAPIAAPPGALAMGAVMPPLGPPPAVAGIGLPLANPPPAPLPVAQAPNQQPVRAAALQQGQQGIALQPSVTTVHAISQHGFKVDLDPQTVQNNQNRLDAAFSEFKSAMQGTVLPDGSKPFEHLHTLSVDVALGHVIYKNTDGTVHEISYEELFEKNNQLKPLIGKLNAVVDDIWGVKGSNVSYRGLGEQLALGNMSAFNPEHAVIKKIQRKGYDDTATFTDTTPRFGHRHIETAMTTVYDTYKKEVLAPTNTASDSEKAEILQKALQKMQAGLTALYTMEQELQVKETALKERGEPKLEENLQNPAEAEEKYDKEMKAYTKEKEAIEKGLQQIHEVDFFVLFSALAVGEQIDPAGKTLEMQRQVGIEQADKVFKFVNTVVLEKFAKEAKEYEGGIVKQMARGLLRRVTRGRSPYQNKPAFFQYAVDAGSVACGLIPNEIVRNRAYIQYAGSHHSNIRVTGTIEEAIVRIVANSSAAGSQGGQFIVAGGGVSGSVNSQGGVVQGAAFQLQGGAAQAPAAAAAQAPAGPLLPLPRTFCKMLDGIQDSSSIATAVNDAVEGVLTKSGPSPATPSIPLPGTVKVSLYPSMDMPGPPSTLDALKNPKGIRQFMQDTCRILRPWEYERAKKS